MLPGKPFPCVCIDFDKPGNSIWKTEGGAVRNDVFRSLALHSALTRGALSKAPSPHVCFKSTYAGAKTVESHP